MRKRFLALLLSLWLLLSGCVIELQLVDSEITAPAVPDGLTVHFIDVGQADCILLEYGSRFLLIDGGNRDDGRLIVSYLEQYGVEELEAVICSHAHEDHVGGLPAVLAVYPAQALYAPTKTYASRYFDDFRHYADQQKLEITVPAPGDTIPFAEDVQVTVLGPVKSYPDTNDTSIVLKVTYGETSFLFTGDMEKTAESDMLNHWNDDSVFRADVLKVGHHGSDTSTGYRFLNAVSPGYGVIPVGKGNDYGHPHREPLERLNLAQVVLLRTDTLGHILAKSDGEKIAFTWQHQKAQPTGVVPAEEGPFIGNRNSLWFHGPFCENLPSKRNRVEFESYDAAIAAGYKPCTGCLG